LSRSNPFKLLLLKFSQPLPERDYARCDFARHFSARRVHKFLSFVLPSLLFVSQLKSETIMAPSAQVDDPEAGGVEVDLNDSQDTIEAEEYFMSADPEAEDHWHEGEPEDAVSSVEPNLSMH